MVVQMNSDLVIPLSKVTIEDVPLVGGKNASLGEMIARLRDQGISVPGGFAVTSKAYACFLQHNALDDWIRGRLAAIAPDQSNLSEVAEDIRGAISTGALPGPLRDAIADAYDALCRDEVVHDVPVAVRSSATAEDLPDASFAGQQATYLHVSGEKAILRRVRDCFASLFTARAIAYRIQHGYDKTDIALSVGVQRMVRADIGASGVAFSIDTETGNPNIIVINGAWGLGEAVVQGAVDPDEFQVFKPLLGDATAPIIRKTLGAKQIRMHPRTDDPNGDIQASETTAEEAGAWCLSDDDILRLATWVDRISQHYDRPMDVEWAIDGSTGDLFIVQARPETVTSRVDASNIQKFRIDGHGDLLAEGIAIGNGAGTGRARLVERPDDEANFEDGDVLVTSMTDPDWLPLMRRAGAIVTERGGRTSHAAIVSRELGVPAVTGAQGALDLIAAGQDITVACCDGSTGRVYDGRARIETESLDLSVLPATRTKIMLNLADPSKAQRWWRLPADGVGLARMEFIVANHIKAHPMALVRPNELDGVSRAGIAALTLGYESGEAYFVDRLAQGIASIAATVWPAPVLVRTTDFKSNEYADLPGGAVFEPDEENPMIGWRGVSRYLHPAYGEAFAMECRALARVRNHLGFSNVNVMLPFCRTPDEGRDALQVMKDNGLVQGQSGLEVFVMCEVPSNVLLIDEFCAIFDGLSIGSNDLTQLVLGIERDSDRLAHLFDESDPAVRRAIEIVIARAHAHGRKVGLCGQGPSDDPQFAEFLVRAGIDSMSVVPDSFPIVKQHVANAERTTKTQLPNAAE